MTVLRDRSTSREDFIFFVDRLATYLIEKAMEHLPHKPRSVITPIDVEYQGQELDANVCLLVLYLRRKLMRSQLCGVSILRSCVTFTYVGVRMS